VASAIVTDLLQYDDSNRDQYKQKLCICRKYDMKVRLVLDDEKLMLAIVRGCEKCWLPYFILDFGRAPQAGKPEPIKVLAS